MAIIELVEELVVAEEPKKAAKSATKASAKKAAQEDKVAVLSGEADEADDDSDVRS
jgi:large subunit ribosomal protein L17